MEYPCPWPESCPNRNKSGPIGGPNYSLSNDNDNDGDTAKAFHYLQLKLQR